MTTTHFYVTDGHEGAGWNKQGVTHRVDTMRHGSEDAATCHFSRNDALASVRKACEALAATGQSFKVHDLTREQKAMQRYRDGRAVHINSLKRWREALRSTAGNPRMVVLVHLGETEVQRDKVELAVRMARNALAGLRTQREA